MLKRASWYDYTCDFSIAEAESPLREPKYKHVRLHVVHSNKWNSDGFQAIFLQFISSAIINTHQLSVAILGYGLVELPKSIS